MRTASFFTGALSSRGFKFRANLSATSGRSFGNTQTAITSAFSHACLQKSPSSIPARNPLIVVVSVPPGRYLTMLNFSRCCSARTTSPFLSTNATSHIPKISAKKPLPSRPAPQINISFTSFPFYFSKSRTALSNSSLPGIQSTAPFFSEHSAPAIFALSTTRRICSFVKLPTSSFSRCSWFDVSI